MRFECGSGWGSVNGCRFSTEAGEAYRIEIDRDGSVMVMVKRRERGEALYTIVRLCEQDKKMK